MASESLGIEDLPKLKHRWDDNIKVYTRKFKSINNNNNNNNDHNNNPVYPNDVSHNNNVVIKLKISKPTTAAATACENEKITASNVDNNNSLNENHVVSNGVVSNTNNEIRGNHSSHEDIDGVNGDHDIDILTEDVPEKVAPYSPLCKVAVEEANSLQPQPDLPLPQQNNVRLRTASGDSTSFNRVEVARLPNWNDENLVNGSVLRPFVSQVDDRLNISVSAVRSKEEVSDLKKKLEIELDQVRKMVKKLNEKEVLIGGYSIIDVETNGPADGHLQFPVNGGTDVGLGGGGVMRMDSETSSAYFHDPRPFRHLSVSVTNNNHHLGFPGEVFEKEKRTPKANQYYRNSEFLLGNDRLPPESNRKSKSAGGRRHGSSEFDGLRVDKKIFGKCSSLLQKIMNHKHGWVFNQPVDVERLGLHDYFDIIKHPMDLGTVKARLAKNWYKTPREFAEDVRLTFHNAMTYNPAGQDVHVMAQELLKMFEEKWPSIESEYDRKLRYEMIRDMGVPTPTPTSRKTYAPSRVAIPMSLDEPPLLHPAPTFQEARNLNRSQSMSVRPESRPKPKPRPKLKPSYSVGRKPAPKKPKAKDPHKRDMTFEEKQKLSTNLQNLPSEKLDSIVQIIRKNNSALFQHDDEIEVDIDSVDTETLWELDRFVTNYKKSLSKYKRKAEIAAQARAAAAQAVQARTVSTQVVQDRIPTNENVVTRETTADQGNVSAPPHAQQERQSNNASGSSSSSSSSSDSGSSSSDSDSDSSSGSDSDGGH